MKKAKQAKKTAQRKATAASTTADVLSSGKGRPGERKAKRVPQKWAANYRNLVQLRNQLLGQMGHLAEEANEQTQAYSMHMADSATDSFDRDFALGLLSSEKNAVQEIDEALERIETGSYGICALTGKPIPKSRLNAIPWTRFSLEAQKELERDGAAARTRLGQIASTYGGEAATEEEGDEEAAS